MPAPRLRWLLLGFWLLLASGSLALIRLGQPASGPLPAPAGTPGPQGQVLRYRLDPERFILLEVEPLKPGPNDFRVTLLDRNLQPIPAGELYLRLRRLDQDSPPVDLPLSRADNRPGFSARHDLEPGWWAAEGGLAGGPAQTFYFLVGSPNGAASDPRAAELLNRAVDEFGRLAGVRWEEQLTSGLPYPTAAGAWVLTEAEAQAPDRVHLKVTLDGSVRETYQVGGRRCDREGGGPWQCADATPLNPFDRSPFRSAAQVSLGRQETGDGEPARVVFFYYPAAEAWYAWWVGEQTGWLRREVMLAPGHVMVARYFDHNLPLNIGLPSGG